MHAHPGILAWILAALALYAAGVRAVAGARTRPWPWPRAAAFAAGTGVALVAVASPLAARAEVALPAHMWQHLLLIFGAAPLLVAGAPLSLALQALRGDARRRLAAAVRSRAARVVTHPVLCWSVFALVLTGTHLTGFYDLATRDGVVHGLEHGLYLAAAVLFWLPVLGANPVRQVRSWLGRLAYLVLAMPPMTVVAAVLIADEAPRYAAHADAAAVRGVSALAEQHEAATLMATAGAAVLVTAAFTRAWQALLDEERRQRVLDRLEAGT